MTDIEERMRLHTPGQVTWPDLETRKKCITCKHFSTEKVSEGRAANGYGRCGYARLVMGRDGAQFKGAEARACPKYEGRK